MKLIGLALTLILVGASCTLFGGEDEPEASGASLLIGVDSFGSLDPSRATGSGLWIVHTACDGLFRLGGDGPTPALVEDFEVDESATTFTLTLKNGLRFHDGEAVTAQAIVESWSRVVRPETSSVWAHLLRDVEGYSDVREGSASRLSGLRARDTFTLEVVLQRPYAHFPALMAHPALVPISPESEKDPPACSGPYEVVFEPDTGLVRLVRDDPSAAPFELLEFRPFEGAEQAYEAFNKKEVAASPVPQRLAPTAEKEPGYLRAPSQEVTFVWVHLSQPPTSHPELRRALSLALERVILIDAAFGDRRRPALGWLAEGRDAGVCQVFAHRVARRDEAISLLKQAEIDPAGIRIPLLLEFNKVPEVLGEALQVQLHESLGITLVPRVLPSEEFRRSFQDQHQPALWMDSRRPDVPARGRLLEELFSSRGQANRIGYSSQEVDRLLLDAGASTLEEVQERRYQEAEDLVCSDMPAVPLWHGVHHWMVDPVSAGSARTSIGLFGELRLAPVDSAR